jgi:NAD(P)-dependent dehydrogenase (short-subunit alcohol dehydrogenase family)
MGNRLEGKVAVVTGAGRGVGRGVALLMAEEGAKVVVNDLGCEVDGTGSSRDPADSTVAEIVARGGEAVANYDNMSLIEGGEAVIKQAVDAYGRVDALVTCVGILRDRMIWQMTPEDWDRVLLNNVKATFTPTKFASIVFRQQRSGHIVHMTSDAGLGDVGRSNYAAASEGIVGLTRTVGRDMGRYGVRCNAISPMAETRLFPGSVEEFSPRSTSAAGPARDERAGIFSPGGVGDWEGPGWPDDPENVAPLAVYLCTDASPNVNCNVFGVRGGSIYLYSNPQAERAVQKWGNFTMEEMDALFPKMIGSGF